MTAIVPPTKGMRRARLFFLGTAAMLAVVLAEGAQFYFQQDRFGRSDPYWLVVAQLLRPWILVAVLLPGIVAFGRRVPLSTTRWWTIPAHLFASSIFAVAHLTLLALSNAATDPEAYPFRFRVLGLMQNYTFQDILVYWTILGALTALWYHRNVVEREREAALLRLSLGEARLGALRAQLHPHLLFNSLNSVSMLVRRGDASDAVTMIADLSELLRDLSGDTMQERISLAEEVEFARRYLALEEIRLGSRLRVSIDIDPSVRGASVPSLLLQPLVENAVRHGLNPLPNGGTVHISARRDANDLIIEVTDDGAGFTRSPTSVDAGVGLKNTRARLAEIGATSSPVTITRRASGGTVVKLALPFVQGARNALPSSNGSEGAP